MDGIPDAEAWAVFGQLSSVVIFLAALAGALWRIGLFRSGRDAKRKHENPPAGEASALAEVQRTQGELAGLSRQVGEIELRTPGPDALGRIHRRLDDLNKQVSRLEGDLKSANRTLNIIQEHLLNKP